MAMNYELGIGAERAKKVLKRVQQIFKNIDSGLLRLDDIKEWCEEKGIKVQIDPEVKNG